MFVWIFYGCIRVKRWVVNSMEMDELLDAMLEPEPVATDSTSQVVSPPAHRDRLGALAAGGQSKQYLGKALSADEIDSLNDDQVEKLYTRYEARLGAAMTKTLGQAALQLYTRIAGMFLPIPADHQPKLIADLETDPFVGHALSSASCELYHRYGMFLAPLTTALTTAKYCQFGDKCPVNNNDGTDEGATSDSSVTRQSDG